MQLRAVRTIASRISISPHRVCHDTYIKALLPIRRKKERERILLPAEQHANLCTTYFSLPYHRRRMVNVQINCMWSMWRETTKERRGRDSKSKRNIKSCRCVSRAQQRGRCQKRLSWDSIGEATRNSEEAISLICRVIKQILQFYPRKYINLARRPDVMQEKWVFARKINDQISRRFWRRHWSREERKRKKYF